MSLAEDLPGGDPFRGWRLSGQERRESPLRRAGIRGSAAFFALLLAAASGGAGDEAPDTSLLAAVRAPDSSRVALQNANQTVQPSAGSKFSRRRLPLSIAALRRSSLPA